MVKFDTIKIGFDEELVLDKNELEEFKDKAGFKTLQTRRFDNNVYFMDKKLDQQLNDEGVNWIGYMPDEKKIHLLLTSKLLEKDYMKLITKNTIEQLLENYGKTKHLKIDHTRVLDTAKIHYVHVTNDIKLEKYTCKQITSNFRLMGINHNFHTLQYKTATEIYSKCKSNSLRINIYDKFIEMLQSIGVDVNSVYRSFDINPYKNTARVESNLYAHPIIRQYFGIDTTSPILLKDLLLSDKKVNYNILKDLTFDFAKHPTPTDDDDSFDSFVKRVGRETIIKERCGMDLAQMKAFLNREGISSANRQYGRFLDTYKTLKDRDFPEENKMLKEFMEQLEQDYAK